MYRQLGISLSLTLLLFVTIGCWDRIEIEERGFVLGSALDIEHENQQGALEHESPGKPRGSKRFVLTNQMVIPGTIGEQGSGETYNISAPADTVFEATRAMASRNSQTPFYEHLKLLILSEEVAKQGYLPDLLDVFLRDHELKRSVQVMISEGEARSILDVKPQNKQMPVMYINSVANNYFKNLGMLPEEVVGDIHEFLLLDQSFVLPRISSNKNEVKITGSAVFHGASKRMVGFLGNEETAGLNIIRNQAISGVLQAKVKNKLVAYEIKSITANIHADVSDLERIKFHISVASEGNLAEKYAKLNPMNEIVISNLEEKFAEEIERITGETIKKTQQVYQADVLGLGTYLRKYHYKEWKQIKENWDRGMNYFTKCDIQVTAKVEIERRGTIIKSHGKEGEKSG